MGNPIVSIQNSFGSGELSPSLFGRIDLQKWSAGASTCRNFFVNYQGGVSTRAGLAYVGMCKQAGTSLPPRDIPFQFNISQGYVLEFGNQYLRFKSDGGYVTENAQTVTSVSNAGLFTVTSHGYSTGDWIFDVGNSGFSELTWIVNVTTTNTFTVTDLFGNPVTTATASTGGTVARLYTVVTPYLSADLFYIKYTQSADVMTLTCVNTDTETEYPSYSLTRNSNTSWTLAPESFASAAIAPTGLTVTAESSTTVDTWYSYVVTSVSGDGEESVATVPSSVQNNDISVYAGSNVLTWNDSHGASSYNVYATTPSYNIGVPAGALYGFIGTSLGTSFTDTNIIPDFTTVPPVHTSPFSRGAIASVSINNNGSSYTQATVEYSITTSTGTGFSGTPIVNTAGGIGGFYVINAGSGYAPGDTITFSDSGSGTGALGTLNVGPETGTYPAVCGYFQQRRVYGNTLNNPDTYFMSQPGLFNNMDSSIPVIDSDAIIGTPWSQQVNGIQFFVSMPGGLVVLTGKGAWQVNGGGSAAITPADQDATPQAYNGCNPTVPPITINYDILYVQAKGSIVRDLSYNFFTNIYTGTDLTVLSNHLFTNYQILSWAWAEEPYKLVWMVRNDGTLLSLTYLKEQDEYSWARHDTNGLFQSVCSVTEPPVDAVYVITKRYIQGGWRYYSERMDNRIWTNVEDSFCVDSGLSTGLNYPAATLSPQATTGSNVPFNTDQSVFNSGQVGEIIRVGGGQAVVTSYVSGTQVLCTVNIPITTVIPNDPNNMPVPQPPGTWTVAPLVTTVSGLNHINGLEVSILADGSVVPSQTVVNNSITLPQPASLVTVGLPFTAQLQTLYLDHPESNTVQNRRKNISAVGVRVEASRGLQIGADQPDQSTQPYFASPTWTNMVEIKERTNQVLAGNPIPLYTGDFYQSVIASWTVNGQVAIQQQYPLPATILAVVAYWLVGDDH